MADVRKKLAPKKKPEEVEIKKKKKDDGKGDSGKERKRFKFKYSNEERKKFKNSLDIEDIGDGTWKITSSKGVHVNKVPVGGI